MPRLTAFSATLVSHETTLPFDTVVARLEERVNKDKSARIISRLSSSQNQQELERIVNETTKGKDFLCVCLLKSSVCADYTLLATFSTSPTESFWCL